MMQLFANIVNGSNLLNIFEGKLYRRSLGGPKYVSVFSFKRNSQARNSHVYLHE